jgi:hypothetical protein
MDNSTKRSPLKTRPLPVAGSETQGLLIDKAFDIMGLIAIFASTLGITLILWQYNIFGILPNRWLMTLVTAGFGIYIWKRFPKFIKDSETYKLGRQGEITVGHILEGLRPFGYTPIHDVLCKGVNGKYFNIDHVLVGPKGIFAVETKTWSKQKGVKEIISYRPPNNLYATNNRWLDNEAIHQSSINADWLKTLLNGRIGKTYDVVPILTLPSWWIDKAVTADVYNAHKVLLLNPSMIGVELGKKEVLLSDSEIKQIVTSLSSYLYDIADQRDKESS